MPVPRPDDDLHRSCLWDQLHWGGPIIGTKNVPNVDDEVKTWSEGIYRVLSVDDEGIPTVENLGDLHGH